MAAKKEKKVKKAILEDIDDTLPTEPVEVEGAEDSEEEVAVPKVAAPIEKVGNADIAGFQPLPEKEYAALNDMQKEDYHARRSKHELTTGPHTMFMIPLGAGERPGTTETVSLNGYRLNVKKGAMVNIPVPMAQIIAEKYQIEMEAGSHMLLDRDERTASALS